MSREMASRSSRSRSYKTTSAPYALVRSRLERGASAGITMVACMFRICAAAATPWAWLPGENGTTPPPRAACGIDDSLLKAPWNLNDPVRCSISGFRNTWVPARSLSAGEDNSGVRTANGAKTRAAPSISTELTGRADKGSIAGDLYRVPRQAGKTLNPDQPTKRGCSTANSTASLFGSTLLISIKFSRKRAPKPPRYVCRQTRGRLAARLLERTGRLAADRHSMRRPTRRLSRREARSRETPQPAGRLRAPPEAPGRRCRSCSETRRRRQQHRLPPRLRPAARPETPLADIFGRVLSAPAPRPRPPWCQVNRGRETPRDFFRPQRGRHKGIPDAAGRDRPGADENARRRRRAATAPRCESRAPAARRPAPASPPLPPGSVRGRRATPSRSTIEGPANAPRCIRESGYESSW